MGRTTTDVHRRVRTRRRAPLAVPSTMVAAALAYLLLVLLAPSHLQGQSLEACGLDLRIGAAVPVGDSGDEIGPGWTLGAGLECPTESPWALRGGVEFSKMSSGSLYLFHASALAGGGLSVPVERWPILLRARVEGGWAFPEWGGSYITGTPRLSLVESGPVLAPGVGLTLVSEDGVHARLDAGARVHFSNTGDRALNGYAGAPTGFDRVVSFVLALGFRL